MPKKPFLTLGLVLFLFVGIAACGGQESETGAAIPVVTTAASSSDSASVVTATEPPPTSATPPPTPMPGSPSPIPPSVTVEPTPLPPTVTVEPSPSPEPATATPVPQPSATATPEGPVDLSSIRLQLQKVIGGLETPVGLAHAGDGSGRLFVVEKVGRIRVVQDGVLLDAPMLDISDRVGSDASEQGLLGLAFHPDYVRNGLFFVNYTDRQGNTVVSRFSMAEGWSSANPPVADPGSEMPVLKLEQPAANHNGGHLAFGPDGYLYIGTGDGGASGDKYGNGQNGATLLGAMLRLDVDSVKPYAVPADNPFVDDPNIRDEIWAIGLRNPWRYTFDRLTGELYIADVGQNLYEEVNRQPAVQASGRNYGWPIMEATHCFPADRDCDRTGLTLPLLEYDHSQGCSVTGGYVYRGEEFPALEGVYVFGDYCSGKIWGVTTQAGKQPRMVELATADVRLSSFGEDERGELYLLDMGRGALFKLIVRSG